MKTLIQILAGLSLLSSAIAPASAGTVSGYYRSNGTYVAPYYRSPADGNPNNNYGRN
jgi:hypothetical protein